MVLITPRLVRALEPDEVPPLPDAAAPLPARAGSRRRRERRAGKPGQDRQARRRVDRRLKADMRTRERTLRSEQGAVFVQVGISLFVLMSFNVFVIDYGMMWIGAAPGAERGRRRCAGRCGRTRIRRLRRSARRRAASPTRAPGSGGRPTCVWQEAGTPVVTFDCPAGVTGRCVRVDVFRDGTNGSTALPDAFRPASSGSRPRRSGRRRQPWSATERDGLPAADCVRRRLGRDRSSTARSTDYDDSGHPLPDGDQDLFSASSALNPDGRDARSRLRRGTSENASSGTRRQPTTADHYGGRSARQLVSPLALPGRRRPSART